MNVEVIVIGDELLIGQVTDTNSGWIARELNHIGWEVTEITTVRDRSREITDALLLRLILMIRPCRVQ